MNPRLPLAETGVQGPALASGEHAARLERLETIFRMAPLGIGIVDGRGHTIMANDTIRLLLGYSAEEFARMSWADYTHPDDVDRNTELYRQMEAGEVDHFSLEKRFICRDGRLLWADLTSAMVRNPDGSPAYVIGMVQDITPRKSLEHELRSAEQHYRLLVERVPAVVYIADAGAEATWHYVSPQIEQMLGFTPQEWQADPHLWLRQVHPEDRSHALDEEARVIAADSEAETHSTSYRMHHRDGSLVWVRDDAMALWSPGGQVTWHGVLVDVTREKQLEARLGHQAFHDPLTGLPNRRLFHERVGQALDRAAATGGSVSVLFVDLDHFKTVNDSFGHAYGDKVIVTAARRIRACVRSDDTAARLGGDEFALLVEGSSAEEVQALAGRLLDALRGSPMRLGDLTVTVAASIGIAEAAAGDTTDTLLRNADLAMYRAKRQGRGRSFRYHRGLHEEVVTRFRMEEALQGALADERITVAYQPIVDLADGAVVGLEALARWTDPELGVVPPDQFVAVAERTGLIKQLGHQVLTRACHGLASWRRQTGADAYISVNVSPLQLDDDFAGIVELRAGGQRPGPVGARPGGHRERAAGGRRPRGDQRAARPGDPGGDRRLRHRLLLAELPARAARRHGQDRPGVPAARAGRRRRPGAAAGADRSGRGAAADHDLRGRGDPRAARDPEGDRLRLRPGLPAGPARRPGRHPAPPAGLKPIRLRCFVSFPRAGRRRIARPTPVRRPYDARPARRPCRPCDTGRMDDYRSPLLDLPGAVAGDGIDAPVAAHYGSLSASSAPSTPATGSSTCPTVASSGSPARTG